MNGKFNAIKTLLNVTGLNTVNVQLNGLARNRLTTGTANYVIINGADGNISEEATLAITRGGTGLNVVPSSQNAGDVFQVNAAKTAIELSAPIGVPAPSRVYNYYRFG